MPPCRAKRRRQPARRNGCGPRTSGRWAGDASSRPPTTRRLDPSRQRTTAGLTRTTELLAATTKCADPTNASRRTARSADARSASDPRGGLDARARPAQRAVAVARGAAVGVVARVLGLAQDELAAGAADAKDGSAEPLVDDRKARAGVAQNYEGRGRGDGAAGVLRGAIDVAIAVEVGAIGAADLGECGRRKLIAEDASQAPVGVERSGTAAAPASTSKPRGLCELLTPRSARSCARPRSDR